MNLEMEGGAKSFYQWDTGQYLAVTGGDTCRQIHFCHRLDENALVCRIREKDGKRVADVPNILLQKAEQIIAYAYEESAEGGKTLWAKSFAVKPRPKPEDYVYTQTEVLSYEALADRVANLEGEGLSQAVADYLKENPPQAGATVEEAAQIRRNQDNIENLSDVKLDASKLPEAVNDALAQAKSSGDFKGEPGDDYVLTEADKQEIAELAAPLVEVPEGGAATMRPLTFTGAVNATYDGSEAVSVEIPAGGGSAEWKRLARIDVAEDETQYFLITTDENGEAFSATDFTIRVKAVKRTPVSSLKISVPVYSNGTLHLFNSANMAIGQLNAFGNTGGDRYYTFQLTGEGDWRKVFMSESNADIFSKTNNTWPVANNVYSSGVTYTIGSISFPLNELFIYATNKFFTGDIIEIWYK